MKPLRFALFVVMAAGLAHAQYIGSRSSDPVIPSFPEHPQHASARELSNGGGITVASGEGNANIPTPLEEPLGTTARRLQAEHAAGKPVAKAVYTNQ